MFNDCIYFGIATLNRRIGALWQEAFHKTGLPPSHGYLLQALAQKPGISQKELGLLLELDPSTINRFADALVRKGLVRKTRSGKGAAFLLTPAGVKTSADVAKTMDDLYRQMQKHFGAQKFKSFVADLRTAKDSLQTGKKKMHKKRDV